jgi:hypothetical protein
MFHSQAVYQIRKGYREATGGSRKEAVCDSLFNNSISDYSVGLGHAVWLPEQQVQQFVMVQTGNELADIDLLQR